MALTTKGEVYTWGAGKEGQLGHGDCKNQAEPKKIENLPPIASIGAGSFFSAALSEEGRVYTWGINEYGQLGIGTQTAFKLPEPVEVDCPQKITQLSCGEDHSALLTAEGEVYSFGFGLVKH